MTEQEQLLEWVKANPREALAAARAARKAMAVRARDDINAFMEFVVKDEATNEPVFQANLHEEWHRLASEHDRLVIWAPVEHGKSQNMAVGRTLWELGRDPSLRFAIMSRTSGQAIKIVGAISRYIERSSELREVFPKLLPSAREADKWTSNQLIVQRPGMAKDPSVIGVGVDGDITGGRVDRLILDDILGPEDLLSELQRERLWNAIQSTAILGRLTERGRAMCIGTAFHPNDAMHRLAKQPGWVWRRTPAVDQDGTPRWPERWSKERIEKKRAETIPIEFARQMLCVARDDAASRFEQAWLEKCFLLGVGRPFPRAHYQAASGVLVIIGVDLAVQQKTTADETVIFTIAVHLDGTREVLSIESGQWKGPEIIERIYLTYQRFGAHRVIVESNAAQAYIIQFAADRYAMPVEPFTTTAHNKMHPQFGVESIATEMKNGKWIFPNDGERHPELRKLEAECLYYSPGAHTGDRLMAMFFAREGARAGAVPVVETGRLDLNRR